MLAGQAPQASRITSYNVCYTKLLRIQGLPRSLSLTEQRLIEAGNDFAFRFLKQAFVEAPDDNLFLAPLSASMALGMTLNGASYNFV